MTGLAFLFFVGLLLTITGGRTVYQYLRLQRTGERVPGTVAELRWKTTRRNGGTRRLCYPVLAFRTADGRDVQAQAGVGRGHAIAEPGEQVPVIYDPRDPSRAEINTATGQAVWFRVIFTLVGVLMICCVPVSMMLGAGKGAGGAPVWFVVGLIFALAGCWIISGYRRFNRTGEQVSGAVVGLRWETTRTGDRETRLCYPVLLFRTLDGRTIRTKTGIGTVTGPRVGDQVPVLYDPHYPARAELAAKARAAPWFALPFVLMGLFLIGYGLFQAAGKG